MPTASRFFDMYWNSFYDGTCDGMGTETKEGKGEKQLRDFRMPYRAFGLAAANERG